MINNSWSEGPKYSAVKMHLSEITGPLCHISADYCEIQPNGAAVNMIMTVFMVWGKEVWWAPSSEPNVLSNVSGQMKTLPLISWQMAALLS